MVSAQVSFAGSRKDRMYVRHQDERRRHTKESLMYNKWRRRDPGADPKKGEWQGPRGGDDREKSLRNCTFEYVGETRSYFLSHAF